MTVQIMKIVILKEVKIMSKKIISQKDAKEIARKNNLANVIIVKKDGTREPFDGNKIIIAVVWISEICFQNKTKRKQFYNKFHKQ